VIMGITRREFLRRSGCGIGTAAALAAGIERFSLINAMAQGSGYKALVCVFLGGGNDGNNMVVPTDSTGYNAYSLVRASSGLAIAQQSLLPITPRSLGMPFGLHPSLAAIHPLFDAGTLAVVCNVGPLVEPLSKENYLSGAPRPYQLFSHSDQIAQWQSSISTGPAPTGWGGRIADTYGPLPGLPMVTALAGGAFTRGQVTSPLSVAAAPTPLNNLLTLNGFTTGSADVARRQIMDYLRTIDRESPLVRAAQDITGKAVSLSQSLNVDPVLATPFPNTSLGNQLKQIAKLIRFNSTSPTQLSRQIFFCSLGGFDTHQNQVASQTTLLTQVGQAMKAFYDSTVEMNLASNVTTFTLSDFGRTFQPAGTGNIVGSDHAWGNHHLVMGGSVFGGDFYGVPGRNGTVFPTLQLSGPDDTDNRGRWIPTSSVDQYAATLARWFDVDPGQINTIFPQLSRFSPSHLGFLP
jgi:uncharacterized protein (DUF1501 family)